jgi:hypothetical protein
MEVWRECGVCVSVYILVRGFVVVCVSTCMMGVGDEKARACVTGVSVSNTDAIVRQRARGNRWTQEKANTQTIALGGGGASHPASPSPNTIRMVSNVTRPPAESVSIVPILLK